MVSTRLVNNVSFCWTHSGVLREGGPTWESTTWQGGRAVRDGGEEKVCPKQRKKMCKKKNLVTDKSLIAKEKNLENFSKERKNKK